MGTEVLRSQDLFSDRFRIAPEPVHRRRNFYGNVNLTNLVVNRKQNNSSGYKKTSPKPVKKRSNPATEVKKSNSTETRRKDDVKGGGGVPMMGRVTLLKRGESLDSLTYKIKGGSFKVNYPDPKPVDDLAVCGTGRIGPDSPGMVPRQIRLPPSTDGYAGSAFSLSPSPRSLPLPSFFKKHVEDGEVKLFDDSATRDLRRLLRLD